MTGRVNILGVGVSAINMDEALRTIDGWIERHEGYYVCVCPVHSIMECRRSEEVRKVFNAAGMVTPDGMPVVWVARWSGHPNVSRVYGPDLMLAVLERERHRHFFYGGGPGVAKRLAVLQYDEGRQVFGVANHQFPRPAKMHRPPSLREGRAFAVGF